MVGIDVWPGVTYADSDNIAVADIVISSKRVVSSPELFGTLVRVVLCLLNTDIDFEVSTDMNSNAFGTMCIASDFSIPASPERFSCSTALDSSPLTAFNCVRVLQASKPSYHLCSTLLLSALPQFPNQEPPRPQQLLLPDLPMVPHLGHTETMAVPLAAGVACVSIGQRNELTNPWHMLAIHHLHVIHAELTFAGLHAFRPLVINILAAKSSTVIEPSTARSATTQSTGFLEHSTLWTRYVISDR